MKENLKPCVYDRREHHMKKCNRVLFVERSGELRDAARGNVRTRIPEGKPSLKRANKSRTADPKPGDLPMSRMKEP